MTKTRIYKHMKIKIKNIVTNFGLSILSILIFLIIAETLTRIFWNSDNEKPYTGIILEGENRIYEKNGVVYKTNSLGIRNREISQIKSSNVVRILALGDSYTWDEGLHENELITYKIEKHLDSVYSQTVEVINSGIGAFNTRDEYNQLVRLYPIYNPDIVILFFFTNDLLPKDSTGESLSWKANTNLFLRENSKFYAFFYYLVKSSFNSIISTPKFILPGEYFDFSDSNLGWVNFKKYFFEIKKYCQKTNAELIFVLIPTLTNLDSNYPYAELIENVSKYVIENNVHYFSFYDLFAPYKPIDLWVSKVNTHWNDKATTIASNALSNYLISNDLVIKKK